MPETDTNESWDAPVWEKHEMGPAERKITDVYDGDRRDSERKCKRLHADSDNSPLDAEFSRAPLKSRPDRCRTLRLEHVRNGDRLGGRVLRALIAAVVPRGDRWTRSVPD